MKEIHYFKLDDITPERETVLNAQGIKDGREIPLKISRLLESAYETFYESAQPVGIQKDISNQDFTKIYNGNSANNPETPVKESYPRAQHLALFALTLGQSISDAVQRLFNQNEFASGAMLDSIASSAADKAAMIAERQFAQKVQSEGIPIKALSYSPGYCGWHISAQREIFEYLQPEEIGIRLNESYLMTPLKSISGVLVAGDKTIHEMEQNYPFCRECLHHSCVARMKSQY